MKKKAKTETKSAKEKKTKAQSSGPSARSLTSEVKEWIKAGMDKEKILDKMIASFIADGKDEAWARKRAKNKLAYIVKQDKKEEK